MGQGSSFYTAVAAQVEGIVSFPGCMVDSALMDGRVYGNLTDSFICDISIVEVFA